MTRFVESNAGTLVLLLLFLLVSALAISCAFQSTLDRVEWREEIYPVQSGDSLWALSGQYCPDNVDRREWIAAVSDLNGLSDSIIHPGQDLTILAPVEEG